MKYSTTIFGLLLLAVSAIVFQSCAEEKNVNPPVSEASAEPQVQRAGGYGAADTSDEGVTKAVAFALGEINKQDEFKTATLAGIQKADVQIVAGRNYRLTLLIKNNGTDKKASVVVYVNLDDDYQISSLEIK